MPGMVVHSVETSYLSYETTSGAPAAMKNAKKCLIRELVIAKVVLMLDLLNCQCLLVQYKRSTEILLVVSAESHLC